MDRAPRLDRRSARRLLRVISAWVALVSIVTFAGVVRFGFVYDDQWTLVRNRFLPGPLRPILAAVARGRASALGIPDATRPTMIVSSWLDVHLFGLSPRWHHLHSLLLYALCCVLAFHLARVLALRTRTAAIAAVLFALAPLHAEAVASINYREDLLAAAGVMVVSIALLRRRARDDSAIEAAAVAFVAWVALLAKESAVVMVVLVPLLAIVARRDLRALVRRRERTLYALGGALCLWANWRFAMLHAGDDVPRASYGSMLERLVATARYSVQSFFASLFPIAWSPERARPGPASLLWIVPLAALVAATVMLARRRSTRVVALGSTLALVAPLASSPIVGPFNPFTDRYLFLSTLGGALVWAVVADRLADRLARRIAWPVASGIFAVAGAALASVAIVAASAWRDERTLWTVATERAPTSPRAWTGYSRALRLDDDLDEAESAARRAIELDPSYLPAHLTHAYAEIALGELAVALADLDFVRVRGGGALAGFRRADHCVHLPPDAAAACIVAE